MPFKPAERQYRSFAASNFRALEPEGDSPSYKVRGYFTVFSVEYCLYERTRYWPAEFEQVDPHALDGADMSDVIFQLNHEGAPLARQRNGSLVVGVDGHGAWCEADLGGCQQGRDLYESIKNGLIVEMSFGFTIASDDDGEGYTYFKDEEGDYHTTITRIAKVFDCSAVTFGANPNTEIGEMRKRSYLAATIEADRKAEEERAAEEAAKAEAEERAAQEAEEAQRLAEQEAMRSRLRLRAKALELMTI